MMHGMVEDIQMYAGSADESAAATRPVGRRGRWRQIGLVALVLTATALATPSAPVAAASGVTLTANQVAVKNALNRDRQLNHLSVLVSRTDAQAKAQAWAERLAQGGTLRHSVLAAGMKGHWCALGENVGLSDTSVKDLESRFMKSPIHRGNILDRRWNTVGVGYAVRGRTIYVVHVFVKTC